VSIETHAAYPSILLSLAKYCPFFLLGNILCSAPPSLIFLVMYCVSKLPDSIYMLPKYGYKLCCLARSEVMFDVRAPFCTYSSFEKVLAAHMPLLPE
jgi:hypothetical protein